MPHHVIESLHVSGGTHFPDAHFDFVDGLNLIIGGRGAGKSGVLHLIRYCLDAPVAEERAEAFNDYVRGTLGAGRVTVNVRTQHGVRYTCTRSYGEPPLVKTSSDGAVAHVSLAGDLFHLEAYGQNEIEGVARSGPASLALIDKLAGAEVRRLGEEIARVERRMTESAAEIARLDAEIEDDAAREKELPSIAEALKGVALVGSADPAEAARAHERKLARGRERTAIGALARELEAARAALDALARGSVERLAAAAEASLEQGPHAEVFRRAHDAVRRAAGAIEACAAGARAEITAAEAAVLVEGRGLAAAHAKEDDAYHALVVVQDADRERAAERERLHRRLEELTAAAKRAADRRRVLVEKRAARASLRKERSRLVRERASVRQGSVRALNDALRGDVRVSLVEGGDFEPYFDLLGELTQGANIRPPELLAKIAAHVRVEDLVRAVETDDAEPILAIDEWTGNKPARAKKILDAIRASGRLHELEIVPVDDVPLLELRTDDGYEEWTKVSEGQRCTCVLPILLLQSAALLLLDQPEDNLDNAYIYDVLVAGMLRAKTERQLIVVSHNPNIPVLGDAERVFALVSEARKGRVAAFGTVDEMRAWIERLLEGGREAFARRGARYGYALEPKR